MVGYRLKQIDDFGTWWHCWNIFILGYTFDFIVWGHSLQFLSQNCYYGTFVQCFNFHIYCCRQAERQGPWTSCFNFLSSLHFSLPPRQQYLFLNAFYHSLVRLFQFAQLQDSSQDLLPMTICHCAAFANTVCRSRLSYWVRHILTIKDSLSSNPLRSNSLTPISGLIRDVLL